MNHRRRSKAGGCRSTAKQAAESGEEPLLRKESNAEPNTPRLLRRARSCRTLTDNVNAREKHQGLQQATVSGGAGHNGGLTLRLLWHTAGRSTRLARLRKRPARSTAFLIEDLRR